jgi:double stranded RNA-specific editase B
MNAFPFVGHTFLLLFILFGSRIFSPHEAVTQDDSIDKHPNRKARGQLRTKIESGEGTIPVKSSDGIQTWDGVLQVNIDNICKRTMERWPQVLEG